jgi:aminoglycoside 3-N-acetyltransferase I
MDTKIIIRKMRKKDIPAVAALMKSMWYEHCEENPDMYRMKEFVEYPAEKWLTRILYHPKNIVLVADYEGKVVGTVRGQIEKWPNWYTFKHIMYVDDVVVDPKFRRKGIATNLVKTIRKIAKEKGVDRLYSKVYNFNKHSSLLFQKVGFKDKYAYYFL